MFLTLSPLCSVILDAILDTKWEIYNLQIYNNSAGVNVFWRAS